MRQAVPGSTGLTIIAAVLFLFVVAAPVFGADFVLRGELPVGFYPVIAAVWPESSSDIFLIPGINFTVFLPSIGLAGSAGLAFGDASFGLGFVATTAFVTFFLSPYLYFEYDFGDILLASHLGGTERFVTLAPDAAYISLPTPRGFAVDACVEFRFLRIFRVYAGAILLVMPATSGNPEDDGGMLLIEVGARLVLQRRFPLGN